MRATVLVLGMLAAVLSPAHAQDAPFAAPEGSVPARLDRALVVDCAAHGVWRAPEGWATQRTPDGDVVALAPDGGAVLVRVQTRTRTTHVRTTADFLRIVTALVQRWAPGASLGEVTEHARSRWHVDRAVQGNATVRGTSMRVRAESRGERQLWFAISPAALSPAVDAAMESYLMLVDHACLCGYDCDHAPSRP